MSDDEDYDSSEDQDYVPSDGEAVSEEENSGDEENLDCLKEDGETPVTGKRKRKSPKKKPKDQVRKRQGGIKLEGEEIGDEGTGTDDQRRKQELEQQIQLEQQQKKEEQEKKRADNLWSSFMSDMGKRPEKKTVSSSGASLASVMSKTAGKPQTSTDKPAETQASTPTVATAKSTITVTKVFDFAGEAVKVTKELDVNSKEGKAELKKQQSEDMTSQPSQKPATSSLGVKRPVGGLGGVLDKINKKPKMGTLEKSKLDWDSFKQKEGISEELKIHNRGKQSYIERMNFLQRTDHRQFEIEKSIRLGTNSGKR